jgi:hypothetical protein
MPAKRKRTHDAKQPVDPLGKEKGLAYKMGNTSHVYF